MPISPWFTINGRTVVQEVFIESGFCHGITATMAALGGFQKVHSVEVDPARYSEGLDLERRLGDRFSVHLGSSPYVFRQIIDRSRPTTFYLDGHYSGVPGEVVDPVYGECPLLAELRAIFSKPWVANPVIVIDDAHMLDRPWSVDLRTRFRESHWPTRNEVLAFLPGYDICDRDNTLYAFPADAARPVFRRPDVATGGTHFTAVIPQGVGDAVWIYQKLAPLCDKITFRLVEFGVRPIVESRAVRLIADLPKVVGIDLVRISTYPEDLATERRLTDVLPDLGRGVGVYFAANPWLERGVLLEAIDRGWPTTWDLGVEPVKPAGLPDRYAVLYVSGDTDRHADMTDHIWTTDQWIEFVRLLYANKKIAADVPIVMVGADYDTATVDVIRSGLELVNVRSTAVFDLSLAELLGLFRGAELFCGYQSGLNVLAGTVGCRQFMMYFPRIAPMGDSWVRPEHRGTRRFTWADFSLSPEEAVTRVG